MRENAAAASGQGKFAGIVDVQLADFREPMRGLRTQRLGCKRARESQKFVRERLVAGADGIELL
jgi:hypothetical protein